MAVLWPEPDEAPKWTQPGGRWVERGEADQSVAEGVLARLLGHDDTANQRIEIDVQNRVAILSGTVDVVEAINLASDLAWRTPGVLDVCNVLTVADGR